MKKAAVFLADGFEEVEALTTVDWLRRADIAVSTVAPGSGKTVMGAHKIPVIADMALKDLGRADSYDALILPGGMPGASNLAASAALGSLLKAFSQEGKWICAICAAPAVVLAPLGILNGRRCTCYPGFEQGAKGPNWAGGPQDKVVVDGKLITSRGPGTAALFAKTIIEKLAGPAAANEVAAAVLM